MNQVNVYLMPIH